MKIQFRCPPGLRELLPRPYAAKKRLPPWLKQLPDRAFCADLAEDIRTVKHCPPFIDALGTGFIMPLATDLHVDRERFEWHWEAQDTPAVPHPNAPIMFHLNEQLTGVPFRPDDRAALKFTNFWTIETPPGYSLLVTHPLNQEDLPFRTLAGVVDTDRFVDGCIQFPAIWMQPDFQGALERGTPIAQCLAFKRDSLQLEFGELEGEHAQRYRQVVESLGANSGIYRKQFRAAKS